jgi:hypothetical protein
VVEFDIDYTEYHIVRELNLQEVKQVREKYHLTYA